MATIIDFSAGKSTRPAASGPAKSTAEIVIFPGVRYERTPGRETAEPASPTGRKRDALLIPD